MPQTHALSPIQEHHDIPASGVALIDARGRIEWANDSFAERLGEPAESLPGVSLDDLAQQLDWLDADAPVAVGARHLLPERIPAGDKTLLVLHDVSELQRLREENAALRLTDDLTGLPNRRAITQALEQQISRSRRYGNPLAVVLVQLGVAEQQIELLGDSADQLALGIARFLRDRLRWVDQIGRWDDDLFLLVLPETTREDADQLTSKIHRELEALRLPAPLETLSPQLHFGIATWAKGDDLRTLLRTASRELGSA
ncbi:MAG: diguanylate cyclase [Gammaproteobacteria bacterium]|nr:MAG: diguanylate cyclase [Gammaproteobacteria bacterium]